MNYRKIYDNLMEKAKGRQNLPLADSYVEKHHIVPKCIGGTNDKNNIVILTASEHFVAHQLLVKIYPNNSKLAYAASMLTVNSSNHQRITNKYYGWLKQRYAKAISSLHAGKPKSVETRRKMSIAAKDKIGEKNNFYGKSHSEQFKKTLSELKKQTYKGSGNPNAKSWNIQFPNGETKTIVCLKDFCNTLGVSVYRMKASKVAGYRIIGE